MRNAEEYMQKSLKSPRTPNLPFLPPAQKTPNNPLQKPQQTKQKLSSPKTKITEL